MTACKTDPAMCDLCQIARHYPEHRFYSPACLHCGARLIQRLGMRRISISECTARRKAVLADWVAQGHAEAEIRRLVKGPLAIQPEAPKEKKKSR